MPSRNATTRWEGDLPTGKGFVSLDSSNAGEFPVSFPTRAQDPHGQTSPEELIAAAHSACYAMSLTHLLTTEGHPASSLDCSAEVTLSVGAAGLAITGVELTVSAVVPGVDAAEFGRLAEQAKQSCPVSRALAGTTITLDASLA